MFYPYRLISFKVFTHFQKNKVYFIDSLGPSSFNDASLSC